MGEPLETTDGLSYDYITQFSMGIFESLNIIIPRINGGSSTENLGLDSNFYKEIRNLGFHLLNQPVSQVMYQHIGAISQFLRHHPM